MSLNKKSKPIDVIVVGGGHAGCEAALAAARLGCKTTLLTISNDSIAQLSCNPAIGGPGKGHLAREIDALGGAMGRVIDRAGIQFRMLNTRKGPAVWAPRAQADKTLYHVLVKKELEDQPGLQILQTEVLGLILKGKKVLGVKTLAGLFYGRAVVIAAGTFLNGRIFIGENVLAGGRLGEAASVELAVQLKEAGFRVGRLKTGTPMRLNSRTIDFSQFTPQAGDQPPLGFSYETEKLEVKQMDCFLGYTNKKTHSLIRKNLDRSPLYSGKIQGHGVRYCPSFEDKIVKFPDKERHQVWLEPEGRNTREIYVNGLSTSMPTDVQLRVVATIPGLERAEFTRFGYGIEYDYFDPTQLYPTLETKLISHLYFAGQITGTTGYEEAACQGLVAGINAALQVKEKKEFIISRIQGYIGVLIDDLVTKGTEEPYRLFTSRVEHRMMLRQDNADLRLSAMAYKIGLISKGRIDRIRKKQAAAAEAISILKSLKVNNLDMSRVLRRPEVSYLELLKSDSRLPVLSPEIVALVEMEIKYEGYIQREQRLTDRLRRLEGRVIPRDFSFEKIHGLKKEAREKLLRVRPGSIGQAQRISGISASDMALLLMHLEKRGQRGIKRTGGRDGNKKQ